MSCMRPVLLVMVLWASVGYAQTSAPISTQIAEAEALVQQLMQDSNLPGMAVSVGLAGHIIWSEGFGFADLEQRVPVWPAITRFRVGSIAKPFTAVAIGQLMEQGKLDIDAPIQQYVPSFPEKQGVITTRMLAGHLGGIRHYQGDENFIQQHYDNVLDALTIFQDDPLVDAPGAKFSYSSYGYNLLGAVVEGASGETFIDYMNAHVFKPLNLDNTEADFVRNIVENRTRYYDLVNGQPVNARPVDNSYKWAGGGFLSTTEDMIKFGFAMLVGEILQPETIELLWTSQKTASGETTGYGMGWFVLVDEQGDRIVQHSGGSVGGTTILFICPAKDLVIAAVTNTSGAEMGQIAPKLKSIFLDE